LRLPQEQQSNLQDSFRFLKGRGGGYFPAPNNFNFSHPQDQQIYLQDS
jgi:hypothetical protein